MAMELGAATALMDKAILIPSIRIRGDLQEDGEPLARMFNLELARPYFVAVNTKRSPFCLRGRLL